MNGVTRATVGDAVLDGCECEIHQAQTSRHRHGLRPGYVGRVGALAVLLGVGLNVGSVVSGLSATALADTSDSAASADSASPSPARQHRGSRAESPARAERRGSKNPGSAAAVTVPRRATESKVATPTPPNGTDAGTGAVVDSVAAQPVPAGAAQPAVERITTPPAAPAAAVAPVVTAPQAVATTGSLTALAVLGGSGDPLAPLAAPLSWATLAVTRRELSRATTASLPALSLIHI